MVHPASPHCPPIPLGGYQDPPRSCRQHHLDQQQSRENYKQNLFMIVELRQLMLTRWHSDKSNHYQTD